MYIFTFCSNNSNILVIFFKFSSLECYYIMYSPPYFQCENFERIQNWLNEQPDFTLYPPSEEDSVSSSMLSSNKIIYEKHFASKSYGNKRKTQDQPYSNEDELSNTFHSTKIFSPNIMRRRRYIPYSYPMITESQSCSYMTELGLLNTNEPSSKIHPNNKCVLNKGNTFPRRNHLHDRQSSSTVQQVQSIPQKRHLQLFDDRYKSLGSPTKFNYHHYVCLDDLSSSKGLTNFASQTMPLDSVIRKACMPSSTLMTKEHLHKIEPLTISVNNQSSMLDSTSLESQNLSHNISSEITRKVPNKFEPKKDVYNGQNNSQMLFSPSDTTGFLESSLPVHDSKIQVSPKLLVVKAYSWPKRPIYFRNENQTLKTKKIVSRKQLNKTVESGYNTEKSEEKWDCLSTRLFNTTINDTFASENSSSSDTPPERPPLPFDKNIVSSLKPAFVSGFNITECKTDFNNSKLSIKVGIPPENSVNNNIQSMQNGTSVNLLNVKKDNQFSPSNKDDTESQILPTNADLKNISLRELIRIHEDKIASVSAGLKSKVVGGTFSTVGAQHGDGNSTKNSWKRHTTIGLHGAFEKYKVENMHSSMIYPMELSNQSVAYTKSSCKLNMLKEKGTPSFVSDYSRTDSIAYLKSISGSFVLQKPVDSTSILMSREQQYQSLISSPLVSDRTEVHQKPFTTLMKDASSQTTLTLTQPTSFLTNHDRIKELNLELENLKYKHKCECEDLIRKLEEQKKVANAYQKLEDRYRRKVYELQRIMKSCMCIHRPSNGYIFESSCNSPM